MKTIDLLTFAGEEVKCVRLSDYEKLSAENARLRDSLNKCADMVGSMSNDYVLAETAVVAIRALLHNA